MAGYQKFLHIPPYSGLLKIRCFFFIIRELKKLSIIKQQKQYPAMKKFFIFLFLASSVSFVGCAKKEAAPEAPAAPAAEAAKPADAAAPAAPAADAAKPAEAPAAPAADKK
ncbi:MAG: hypothetical protein WCH05_08725 [Chlorobiaceae bacterium]